MTGFIPVYLNVDLPGCVRVGGVCVKVIKEPARKTPKINIDFCNTNLGLLHFSDTN
jgi:hypothetical protein